MFISGSTVAALVGVSPSFGSANGSGFVSTVQLSMSQQPNHLTNLYFFRSHFTGRNLNSITHLDFMYTVQSFVA